MNRTKLIALATVIVTVGTGIAFAQGNGIANLLPAAAFTQQDIQQRSVSLKFESAPAQEVIRHLVSLGVNIVVADDALPGSKITINIENKPLGDVMNAVAEALGGHWVKKNDVYVFHQGTGPMVLGMPAETARDMPLAKIGTMKLGETFPKIADSVISANGEVFRVTEKALAQAGELAAKNGKLDPKVRAQIEQEMKAARGEMAKAAQEMAKVRVEQLKSEKMFDQDKVRAQLGKALQSERMHEIPNIKEMPGLDTQKLMKELDAQMKMLESHLKALSAQGKLPQSGSDRFDLKEFQKNMQRVRELLNSDGRTLWITPDRDGVVAVPQVKYFPRISKDAITVPKLDVRRIEELKDPNGLKIVAPKVWINNGNFEKLYESLTEKQKATMKQKGYLTPADLTDAQRKLIGTMPDSGNWTVSYSNDGKTITIKSGK